MDSDWFLKEPSLVKSAAPRVIKLSFSGKKTWRLPDFSYLIEI